MNHCGQLRVVHHDMFGGILRRGAIGGNHHGDDVADMVHFIGRHRMVRWNEQGRTIRVAELDIRRMTGSHRMRNRLQSVVQHVATRQHREHARCGSRGGHVDGSNVGVRVRGTDHDGVGLPRHVDVVAVAPAPGQQAQVFPATHRLPDPGACGAQRHRNPPTCIAIVIVR